MGEAREKKEGTTGEMGRDAVWRRQIPMSCGDQELWRVHSVLRV